MTNRWTSAPGWSWFGGHSDEIAAIWNKRKFSGDFSLHLYFAFKEGMVKEAPNWRVKNADVGLSFCGDGNNLGSGYTLILGADNNRHSVLLKQSQVIAEATTHEAVFPSWADGQPYALTWSSPQGASRATGSGASSGASSGFRQAAYGQRHWWHAVIDKFDNRVECWLDGKLLFMHDDPEPLNQGQIALWTFNNGIVLSRVQIYYENEIKRSYVKNSLRGEPIGAQNVSEPVKSEVATR